MTVTNGFSDVNAGAIIRLPRVCSEPKSSPSVVQFFTYLGKCPAYPESQSEFKRFGIVHLKFMQKFKAFLLLISPFVHQASQVRSQIWWN